MSIFVGILSQVLSPSQLKTLFLLLLPIQSILTLPPPRPPPLCFRSQLRTSGHLSGHAHEDLRPIGMLGSPLAPTCHWTPCHHLCGREVASPSVLHPVAKVRLVIVGLHMCYTPKILSSA